MTEPANYMNSPVTDSDRLEAIFEQVASIRSIAYFWSILSAIGLFLIVITAFIQVAP